MNWRAVLAITYKDLKVVVQSKAVMLPLIIVPLILLLIIPTFAAIFPQAADTATLLGDLDEMKENMPSGLEAELDGLNDEEQWIKLSIVFFMAPFFLIIPLMVASVIASDSFAGEKERKTLEALIYTPTTDWELFMGKVLAAWIPALGVTFGGFVVYAILANVISWPVMGRIFFPNLMWIVLVIWVAPAAAGLGLSSIVLVSSRVKTFQEASQLGGVVVVPLVLLVIGQAAGVIYFSIGMVLLLGLALWIVDGILLWIGVRGFNRSELIAQL